MLVLSHPSRRTPTAPCENLLSATYEEEGDITDDQLAGISAPLGSRLDGIKDAIAVGAGWHNLVGAGLSREHERQSGHIPRGVAKDVAEHRYRPQQAINGAGPCSSLILLCQMGVGTVHLHGGVWYYIGDQ